MRHSIIAFLAVMAIVACGNDNDDTNPPTPPPPTPARSITLESQTISNEAEVDATTTKVLTLTYNTEVRISGHAAITLNGNSLMGTSNATSAKAIDIPLTLKEGTSYTLHIQKGSVIDAADATVTAPDFTLTFKTKEADNPVTPTNPQIAQTPVVATTDAAQKLYGYFLEQYGQKTISSVMANVNWNNDCAEKVYKLTGKYPAMNCYDFIHICFSPANWIDYTTIAPVQSWVNGGGIVQLMWHFNVPAKEGSTDYTCSPGQTTFRAKNIFNQGSWENQWFYGQMDKVAATILKLQEAGIAATWRPFHEAAGNATFKQQASWTTAWFWWGYDGAETYKKLWVAMFDYFKQKGINNLIWIWTTQNYNGNSSQYNVDANWYPGDQYVDMIARDLYGYNAAQNQKEFTEIQARYPNKMVVLGECGKDGNSNTDPAKMGDCWNADAKWGHFMVWYDGNAGNSTATMCSDSWWKASMSAACVITRDELPNLK